MEKTIVFLFICLISSCNCPECETFPEPLRIVFMDNDGNNLLETDELAVTSILNSATGRAIEFAEKDFVVKNSKEKMHVEILSEQFYDELINSEGTFYINFDNGQSDTLLYGIDEVEGKCCSSYRDLKFIYNSDDLTGVQENTIGAYQIIVE
jgi:hypothetical protein